MQKKTAIPKIIKSGLDLHFHNIVATGGKIIDSLIDHKCRHRVVFRRATESPKTVLQKQENSQPGFGEHRNKLYKQLYDKIKLNQ